MSKTALPPQAERRILGTATGDFRDRPSPDRLSPTTLSRRRCQYWHGTDLVQTQRHVYLRT